MVDSQSMTVADVVVIAYAVHESGVRDMLYHGMLLIEQADEWREQQQQQQQQQQQEQEAAGPDRGTRELVQRRYLSEHSIKLVLSAEPSSPPDRHPINDDQNEPHHEKRLD